MQEHLYSATSQIQGETIPIQCSAQLPEQEARTLQQIATTERLQSEKAKLLARIAGLGIQDGTPPFRIENEPEVTPQDMLSIVELDGYTAREPESRSERLLLSGERLFPYRQAQVLCALLMAGGTITPNRSGGISSELSTILSYSSDTSTLKRTCDVLKKDSLVAFGGDTDNKSLQLLPAGVRILEILKAHPDLIRQAPKEKEIRGTSYKILRHIAELTDGNVDRWAFAPNGDQPVYKDLSEAMGVNEQTLTRRVHSLYKERQFVDLDRTHRNAVVKNIKLTEVGLEYLKRLEETQETAKGADAEDLLDENEVDEVDSLTLTCIELAKATGNEAVVADIVKSRAEKHLFEYSRAEFGTESLRIERLVDSMRELYVSQARLS